jgi:nucleotide-binding universal stress UspA family protein
MASIKRILMPTDFSETSDAALEYAVVLARAFSSSVHLLHVVRDISEPGGGWHPPLSLLEEQKAGARETLSKLVERQPREVQVQTSLRVGSPFVEIVRCAKELEADLIVMGTHGRGPVAHMLMGSVAEKVVRKAPCPVLTVRPPAHKFVMP